MGDATSKLIRGLLEVFILEAVAREPRHGYALIRELETVFGEPPNRNQVYPLLNRLEKEGYLKADRSEGRGKTLYALTGKGLELLKDYRLRTGTFRDLVRELWVGHDGPHGPLGQHQEEAGGEDDAPGPSSGHERGAARAGRSGEGPGEAQRDPDATPPGNPAWDDASRAAATSGAAGPSRAPEPRPRPDAPPGLLGDLRFSSAPSAHAAPSPSEGTRPPHGHAGGPCQAEVALRRRLGTAGCSVEVDHLDPACATCQAFLATFRDLRDRWF